MTICGGKTFGCIQMDDFLQALVEKVTPNDTGAGVCCRCKLGPVPGLGQKREACEILGLVQASRVNGATI